MGTQILLDPGVDAVVVALCADFDRRVDAVNCGSVGHKVEMEYKYLNYKMLEAAMEIVGESFARLYIREIGSKTGYASSECTECERTYKIKKREVKYNIARRLNLCD